MHSTTVLYKYNLEMQMKFNSKNTFCRIRTVVASTTKLYWTNLKLKTLVPKIIFDFIVRSGNCYKAQFNVEVRHCFSN